jgi:hypothetical protein
MTASCSFALVRRSLNARGNARGEDTGPDARRLPGLNLSFWAAQRGAEAPLSYRGAFVQKDGRNLVGEGGCVGLRFFLFAEDDGAASAVAGEDVETFEDFARPHVEEVRFGGPMRKQRILLLTRISSLPDRDSLTTACVLPFMMARLRMDGFARPQAQTRPGGVPCVSPGGYWPSARPSSPAAL